MEKIYYIPCNRRLLLDSFFVVKSETMYLTTVNDRLSALGAYLKTKAFGWELVRTGCLIRSGRLLKKSKKKKKKKKCHASKFFTKITIPSEIDLKNRAFPFVQISVQI